MIDYNSYQMTLKEKALYILMAAALTYPTGYIFYRSHILSVILSFLAFLYPRFKVKAIIAKRKKLLNLQFRDMLYSLSSSISAGKPVERAFYSVRQDLSLQYPDPGELINREVAFIIGKIEINEPVEDALDNLAQRAHLEDISSFADVFRMAKRSGGNLVEVIKNTSNIINDKFEICQEIDTLLAEKKLEQKVLTILPAALVLLLSTSAGDYMRPVFGTLTGRVVTTIALILIIGANLLFRRVLDIKV